MKYIKQPIFIDFKKNRILNFETNFSQIIVKIPYKYIKRYFKILTNCFIDSCGHV